MQFLNQNSVIELFPIPIVKTKLEISNNIVEELKKMPLTGNNNNVSSESHTKSELAYILDLEKFRELETAISSRLVEYTKHIMSFEYPHRITQSWLNKFYPGKSHHKHLHPNSIVSGIFYIDLPYDTDTLIFHKNYSANTFIMSPRIEDVTAKNNYYAFDSYQLEVSNYDLILFPSYLENSVPINSTDKPKWSLAFNSVPVYCLGSYSDLTQLSLGDIRYGHDPD